MNAHMILSLLIAMSPPDPCCEFLVLAASEQPDDPARGAVPPTPLEPGSRSKFPDESTTGIRSGVVLKAYQGTLHITTENATVSDLEVNGDIVIDARNVTLRNIRLNSATPWHALRVMENATGFTLEDSEIDGLGRTNNAVYGFGTFLRNDVSGAENGMMLWGPSTVSGNFIHDLRNASNDPHYDGIQIPGGRQVSITGNTIVNNHSQTAAVALGNTFGDLSDIVVSGNRLQGGGYTVQVDGRKGGGRLDSPSIQIRDNLIGGGIWGDFAFWNSNPVTSGNTDLHGDPTNKGR